MNHFHMMIIFSLMILAACVSSPPPPTPKPAPASVSDSVEMGREVFLRACAECHGQNAEGYANELTAPALDPTEHAWHHPDQQIHDWIVNDKLGLGREIPALCDKLSDDEIHAVVDYLHILRSKLCPTV